MKSQIFSAIKILIVMIILTGIVYPLVMTGIAQLTYPKNANGSLIMKDGIIVGSERLAQNFDSTIYFWARPSAISFNPVPSGATNYGPTSDTLKKLAESRGAHFTKMNSVPANISVPPEMLFASGSGLDPHISPEAALLQVDRVSEARHFDIGQKEKLIRAIEELTEAPQFLVLGMSRINVLSLNLKLDEPEFSVPVNPVDIGVNNPSDQK